MRVVVDTNVIVSGIYDPSSVPGRILSAAIEGKLALCAPDSVRTELKRILTKQLDFGPAEVYAALQALRIEWIPESIYRGSMAEARSLLRDPDDVPVLACGLALECDIVTGDKDLHAAKARKIRVWKPSELERGA